MKISYNSSKLEKILNSEREIIKNYGAEQAKKIRIRMSVLMSANNLGEISRNPPDRCHPLDGQRRGQFAVDIKHPYRIVFEPTVNPPPLLPDGGVDLAKITEITILEVEDYH